MNILWITLESILPANSGGRLGVYKRLEQIVKTENVYLFYPYDGEDELQYADELRKVCKAVYPYYRGANKRNALGNLFRYPYTVGSRCIPQMQEDIRRCLAETKIDLINVDFPHMCVNLLGDIQINCPIILNEHNIEWKVYRTIAASQKNLLKKAAYWLDSFRLKRFEKKVFSKLNLQAVTFVSDKDMLEMQEEGNLEGSRCFLIPVGADKMETSAGTGSGGKNNILFVGKMSYGPNIEAVNWFVRDVFPRILEKKPESKFYIVGKDPSEEVKKLACDRVIVTGMVESVSAYYDLADLVVLPLKNGGGVKVKLLEAISYHKSVVSTPTGVEGTDYQRGDIIPVTAEAGRFAELCVSMLNDAALSQKTADAAYRVFLEKYTWESVGEQYLTMMKRIVACYDFNR